MRHVRVRFAPSPTGPLHIGGVRTALFNYLFAKQNGGSFVLRIEDTDKSRYVEGAEHYIQEALQWCGLQYDEGPGVGGEFGPYRQSERKHLYLAYAEQLVEKGYAYYAFDPPEKLDFHRKDHEAKGKTFIYNWHNRLKLNNSLSLSSEEVSQKLSNNEPYVIRFKCPQNKTLTLQDIIRGTIEIDSNTLDDKVIFKSDGMPTYHLANIVDDHLMEISHVIRGEEWLPSLPLHYLLYDAFGWTKPKFAHLPLIMKPTGKGKLSKRDGEKGGFPVFPLHWKESQGYRDAGYFPEAVVNFLAMLGWNPGTEKEFFSLEELVQEFSLARVNKSGARFDPDKTVWYNRHYLQEQQNSALTEQFIPLLLEKGISPDVDYVTSVINLIKDRADFVRDFWHLSDYFFIAPNSYPEKVVKKQWKDSTAEIMKGVSGVLNSITDFSSQTIETQVKSWITAEELSFGKVMPPLRLVIVGDMKGPHLFDIIALLGKNESLSRIRQAVDTLH